MCPRSAASTESSSACSSGSTGRRTSMRNTVASRQSWASRISPSYGAGFRRAAGNREGVGVAPPGRVDGGLGSCRTPGGTRQDSPAGIARLRGEAIMTFAQFPAASGESVSCRPAPSPANRPSTRRCPITTTTRSVPGRYGEEDRTDSRASHPGTRKAAGRSAQRVGHFRSADRARCAGKITPRNFRHQGRGINRRRRGGARDPGRPRRAPHRAALRPVHDHGRHAGALGGNRHGAHSAGRS